MFFNMEISELFEQYTSAFNSLNAGAIAQWYSIPCATIDGDGKQVFSERSSLIQKFAENCQAMIDMHYKSASFNIVEVIELGASNKAVNIHWQVLTSQSSITFGCLYMCSLQDQKWQIFSACVYNL